MHTTWITFLPEITLIGLAILLLSLDMFEEGEKFIFSFVAIGLSAIALLIFFMPQEFHTGSFSSYRNSSATLLWKLIFTLAALGTCLLSKPYFSPITQELNNTVENTGLGTRGALTKPGAYFSLIIFCTIGMFTLVSSHDLLTFYLGLELTTLPLYALVVFQFKDAASVEAGSKYVIMGGFSSALTLFGISFLYGVSGGVGFENLASATVSVSSLAHHTITPLLWCGALFLLSGIGFKLAMAPFHMWAPDVYEGAPTPVMAFLSIGSKAGAVAALLVIFMGPLNLLRGQLEIVFSVAAVSSMVVGNLGAMRQKNLHRFIGYSSIAQVGYMILAMLGDVDSARLALQYNLVTYAVTSFAFYFLMSVIDKNSLDISTLFRGLHARHSGLAALLVLCMFSFAGIPPLAGFLGKFLIFSTLGDRGHYYLLGMAIFNVAISFYYYILIVKEAYIVVDLSNSLNQNHQPLIRLNLAQKVIFVILSTLLIFLGISPIVLNWIAAHSI